MQKYSGRMARLWVAILSPYTNSQLGFKYAQEQYAEIVHGLERAGR